MIPTRRRPVSLRALVVLVVAGAAAYFIVFALFLILRILPQADRLNAQTASILNLFDVLAARSARVDAAAAMARVAVLDGDVVALDSVRRMVRQQSRGPSMLLTEAPAELRTSLASTEIVASEMESRLNELVSLEELGDRTGALRQLRSVDSLHGVMSAVLVTAERRGFAEMAALEFQLSDAVRQAVTAMFGWVALGSLLLLGTVVLARRRVQRPLAELEAGLDSVARGDLGVSVRVRRHDELGNVLSHFNDMTAVLRARAEEQGRFAAAGQLIAGVAHEVNNPLMAIAALADTRLDDPNLQPELRGELQQIRRQARRAGKLLSGLLRFVRVNESRDVAVSLNDVIRSATDLVSYRFVVEEITLELHLDVRLPMALGAPARLEQVFVNLLSNALDALRGSPRPRTLTISTWADGDQVLAAVADSGPGIAPEMRARLFHPFATTKGSDGTGLGLYISRQIVREAGGDLRQEPSRRGARFVLALRRAPSTAPTEVSPVPSPPPPERGLRGVDVLLVDDEDAVRSPIARYLRRRGASVREARDGLEALAAIEAAEPDVIVADLRMPRMDGEALCARLSAERPELVRRLMVLSGDLSQLGGALPVPAERVLSKPVELKDIEARIRSLVEGHSANGHSHA